jgi:sugar/nucleoside kinase (ribokinase family)
VSVREREVIVAGHICLDLIPDMSGGVSGSGPIREAIAPGRLIEVGSALLSTGGAVSNTGIALHKLGAAVKLMGKVGNDLFGSAVLEKLRQYGPELAEGMLVAEGEPTSYTVVISPPGVDRIFLHCTGANDTFSAADILPEALVGARLFHFGYPPLMRGMYADEGRGLELLLQQVKARGLTVSLDMARPDPQTPAGRADWQAILRRALPNVDLFLPSFDEILFMLEPERYAALQTASGGAELVSFADEELLSRLSGRLLELGAAVVGLKLGEHGLYVRTTADRERFAAMGACTPVSGQAADWLGRELLVPCFSVQAAGTTGAGDCTIAGFLYGLLQGRPLVDTVLGAVAVGACNVERADAVSGIPAWSQVQRRLDAGWSQREQALVLPGWTKRAAERGSVWEKR